VRKVAHPSTRAPHQASGGGGRDSGGGPEGDPERRPPEGRRRLGAGEVAVPREPVPEGGGTAVGIMRDPSPAHARPSPHAHRYPANREASNSMTSWSWNPWAAADGSDGNGRCGSGAVVLSLPPPLLPTKSVDRQHLAIIKKNNTE